MVDHISFLLFDFELLGCRKLRLIIPHLAGRFRGLLVKYIFRLLLLEHLKDEPISWIDFAKDAIGVDTELLLSSDTVQFGLVRGPPRDNLSSILSHNIFVEILSPTGLLCHIIFSFLINRRINLPFQSMKSFFLSIISFFNDPGVALPTVLSSV